MSEPRKPRSPRTAPRSRVAEPAKSTDVPSDEATGKPAETLQGAEDRMGEGNAVVIENEPPRAAANPAAPAEKVEAKHADDDRDHDDDHGEQHEDDDEHHDDDDRHPDDGDGHEDDDGHPLSHRDDHEDHHDDDRPAPARREELRQPLGPADEYQFQVHFDRQSRRYWGTVAEFPEIRMSANSPEAALEDVRMAVEDHVELVRRRNEPIPEPMAVKVYPQAITLNLSQGLYRRLDALSRYEKVALEQLVGELLSGAVEKRFEPARSGGGNRQQQHGRDGGGGNHQRNDGHQGNRRGGANQGGGGQGGGHRNNRGSSSREVMENRESFMEYVRNLEKGGGPAGGGSGGGGRDGGGRSGWKKR